MYVFRHGKRTAQLLFKTVFPKSIQASRMHLVNSRHQTPQTLLSASLEPPVKYSSFDYKFDIQESDGNMFNPIFR